jgi:hypothetical protein
LPKKLISPQGGMGPEFCKGSPGAWPSHTHPRAVWGRVVSPPCFAHTQGLTDITFHLKQHYWNRDVIFIFITIKMAWHILHFIPYWMLFDSL